MTRPWRLMRVLFRTSQEAWRRGSRRRKVARLLGTAHARRAARDSAVQELSSGGPMVLRLDRLRSASRTRDATRATPRLACRAAERHRPPAGKANPSFERELVARARRLRVRGPSHVVHLVKCSPFALLARSCASRGPSRAIENCDRIPKRGRVGACSRSGGCCSAPGSSQFHAEYKGAALTPPRSRLPFPPSSASCALRAARCETGCIRSSRRSQTTGTSGYSQRGPVGDSKSEIRKAVSVRVRRRLTD